MYPDCEKITDTQKSITNLANNHEEVNHTKAGDNHTNSFISHSIGISHTCIE